MPKQDRRNRTWEAEESAFRRALTQEILKPGEWPSDPQRAERWRNMAPLTAFFTEHLN